jgi:hypothetical protein
MNVSPTDPMTQIPLPFPENPDSDPKAGPTSPAQDQKPKTVGSHQPKGRNVDPAELAPVTPPARRIRPLGPGVDPFVVLLDRLGGPLGDQFRSVGHSYHPEPCNALQVNLDPLAPMVGGGIPPESLSFSLRGPDLSMVLDALARARHMGAQTRDAALLLIVREWVSGRPPVE